MTEPVITQPEDLQPEDLSLIENLPTERTATVLTRLLTMLAEQTDLDENRIVQVQGCVREYGWAGLYLILAQPGSAQVIAHAVAWYDGMGKFGADVYPEDLLPEEADGLDEERAKRRYDEKGEELDHA